MCNRDLVILVALIGAFGVGEASCGPVVDHCSSDSDCPDEPCHVEACRSNKCVVVSQRTPPQSAGDCSLTICVDDKPTERPDPSDAPSPTECTTWVCSSAGQLVPERKNKTDGISCSKGTCSAGECR